MGRTQVMGMGASRCFVEEELMVSAEGSTRGQRDPLYVRCLVGLACEVGAARRRGVGRDRQLGGKR